jgi:hypothetical protein
VQFFAPSRKTSCALIYPVPFRSLPAPPKTTTGLVQDCLGHQSNPAAASNVGLAWISLDFARPPAPLRKLGSAPAPGTAADASSAAASAPARAVRRRRFRFLAFPLSAFQRLCQRSPGRPSAFAFSAGVSAFPISRFALFRLPPSGAGLPGQDV